MRKSKADFDLVQKNIASRRRQRKDGATQIFAGLVKCADCGWTMGYCENKQNKKPYPQAMVTHILYHLLDKERNILGLFTSESSELFLGFFREYLSELIAGHMLNGLELNAKKVPEDFLINHISSSFVGMIQWWVKNGLKQSPEAMSEYFMAVIAPAL